jgi:hypothetical protein
MNIKRKLLDLITYYNCTRGVGHTQGMLEGANYTDNALILVSNRHQVDYLKKQIGSPKSVYITSDSDRALRGCRKPLFIDNAETFSIFRTALSEIEYLESEIAKRDKALSQRIW